MANKFVDAYLVYNLIMKLITPFNKWPAYKLGIIDDEGTVLRPQHSLKTVAEHEAWGRFDIMTANLKKILGKLPGGKTRLANYAAAAFLFKEHANYNEDSLDQLNEDFTAYLKLFEDGEVPANNVGGGNIAGVGIGPKGEPPMGRNVQLKRLRKIMKRKPVNVGT